ncbi:MAG TPA: hypothetical protein VHB73_01160 [Alphaproteobacteria bacterium]|nr:hypothetical protein [Alphaproteobacteria bacterium]
MITYLIFRSALFIFLAFVFALLIESMDPRLLLRIIITAAHVRAWLWHKAEWLRFEIQWLLRKKRTA